MVTRIDSTVSGASKKKQSVQSKTSFDSQEKTVSFSCSLCFTFRYVNDCSRPQVNLGTANGKKISGGNINEDGHAINNGDDEQPPM
jgi:hypothetical protein